MALRFSSIQHLSLRDPQEYTESLKEVLKQITMNETAKVVGSAAYKVHKYPSDIDVFEQVTANMSRDVALDFYVDQFKNIAQRLQVNSHYFKFTDFKSGMDRRFDVKLPKVTSKEYLQHLTVELANKYSLPKNIAVDLFQATESLNEFKDRLKKYRDLHWTLEEMVEGSKKLFDCSVITLREALNMDTVTKLDVVVWSSGRFLSVEAFFHLRYINQQGEIMVFHSLGNYIQGLREDIEKYSSEYYYSPLKIAKRMWSLSKVLDCENLLEALNPLFSSNTAALNQISSDAEILQLLLETNLTKKQIVELFSESLMFYKRASNHLEESVYPYFQWLINQVAPLYHYWRSTGVLCREEVYKLLQKVRDVLKPVIVKESAEYLKMVLESDITCIPFGP